MNSKRWSNARFHDFKWREDREQKLEQESRRNHNLMLDEVNNTKQSSRSNGKRTSMESGAS